MTLDPAQRLMRMESRKLGIYLERDGGDHYDKETRTSFELNQRRIKEEI